MSDEFPATTDLPAPIGPRAAACLTWGTQTAEWTSALRRNRTASARAFREGYEMGVRIALASARLDPAWAEAAFRELEAFADARLQRARARESVVAPASAPSSTEPEARPIYGFARDMMAGRDSWDALQ
jgi:hypothetical protein